VKENCRIEGGSAVGSEGLSASRTRPVLLHRAREQPGAAPHGERVRVPAWLEVGRARANEHEEEIVYVISGRGRLVTPEPPRTWSPALLSGFRSAHTTRTESDGPEPLEVVCVYSPPIVPGGYERGPGRAGRLTWLRPST